MKKLMIVAAIAMVGVAANAASFSWTSTGNFCDKNGTVLTESTVPAGDIVLVYLGNGTADWDKAKDVQVATVKFNEKMGTAKVSSTFNFTAITDYKNGDIFGVMFKDGDDNLSKLQYVAGGDVDTTYTITGLADDTSNLESYTFAASNYYAQSVPEPTSGLLLLLGVAGMALRRRRA